MGPLSAQAASITAANTISQILIPVDSPQKVNCTQVYSLFFLRSHLMLTSVQTLRALAAWLVVMHHYMQIVHNFSLTDPLSIALQTYGAVGVDLFFIISGFVIYISASGKSITPGIFIAHRLARIVPAYWIFTTITAAVLIAAPNFVPLTQFEAYFFLKSLLFIPAQNPSGVGPFPLVTVGWTLNYEMAFYGLFLLSLYGPKTLRLPLIALGLFVLCKFLSRLGGDLAFYANKIVYEFLFGILIAMAYKRGWVQRTPLAASLTLLALGVGMIVHVGQVLHKPLQSGLPCALILLAAVSLERFFPKSGVLVKLGDWSYSTYLSHVLVMCLMMKVQHAFNLNAAFTFVLIILTLLAVSYISFTFVEKPISNMAKRNFKAQQPAPIAAA